MPRVWVVGKHNEKKIENQDNVHTGENIKAKLYEKYKYAVCIMQRCQTEMKYEDKKIRI